MPENTYFVFDFEKMRECNGDKMNTFVEHEDGSIMFMFVNRLPKNYFVQVLGQGSLSFIIHSQTLNSFRITIHSAAPGEVMFIFHEY